MSIWREFGGLALIWGAGAVAIGLAVIVLRRPDSEELEDDGPTEPLDPEMEAWAEEVEAMAFEDTYEPGGPLRGDAGDDEPRWLGLAFGWAFFGAQIPFLLLGLARLLRQWTGRLRYGAPPMPAWLNVLAMAFVSSVLCFYVVILVESTKRYRRAKAASQRRQDDAA